jgi:hypothetical protein
MPEDNILMKRGMAILSGCSQDVVRGMLPAINQLKPPMSPEYLALLLRDDPDTLTIEMMQLIYHYPWTEEELLCVFGNSKDAIGFHDTLKFYRSLYGGSLYGE